MRLVRFGLVGIVAATSLAAPAGAQEARLFQDSWFWGLHLGSTAVGTAVHKASGAATVGGEWLITRTRGGMYVAYDQANFDRTARVSDAAASGGARDVAIRDMRTISAGAVAFPDRLRFGSMRPYAGMGFALNLIGSAAAQPDVVTTPGETPAPVSDDVANRVEDAKSRTSVFFLGGAQWQVRRTAVFGQLMVMPSSDDFLVTRPVTMVTMGVRYNFGPSIER